MKELLSLCIKDGATNNCIETPKDIPTGGLRESVDIIGNAMAIAFSFCVFMTLAFLIWGGIQWIQSGGDKAKVQAARMKITYAVIGLIVVFLSFAIISVVSYIFGVDLLSIPTS